MILIGSVDRGTVYKDGAKLAKTRFGQELWPCRWGAYIGHFGKGAYIGHFGRCSRFFGNSVYSLGFRTFSNRNAYAKFEVRAKGCCPTCEVIKCITKLFDVSSKLC